MAEGAVEGPAQLNRAPSDPPRRPRPARPQPHQPSEFPIFQAEMGGVGAGGGGRRTSMGPWAPGVSCLTGKGAPCGWAGQGRGRCSGSQTAWRVSERSLLLPDV